MVPTAQRALLNLIAFPPLMYAEFFAYAINSLKQRSLRSWLTVLGIVIGIASIIVLVSLAQGLNAGISEQLEKFGSRTIVVIPGGSVGLQSAFSSANYRPPSIGKLYKNDAERLKKIEGVEYISTVIQTRPDISFKKESITASVNGIEPSVFKQTQALEIEKGRFLTDTDRQVAVIGEKIASDAFDEKVEVGSVFRMGSEKKSFRVVGVLKKSGSQSGMDSAIYVPVEDARSLAGDSLFENEVSAIRLTIVPDADIAGVKERITSELLSAHKLREEEKDFSLITSDFLKEQIGAITDMLSLFLGGVAAVSLIVGGVGIANTMFMAVLERTKEIGTLKAVGADEKKITKMFLIESGLLGFA
ncbi:hypothetical protein COV61_03210, partial [Candidatus Micrarchaeota archaeon CG11_big_fil_rev_8_21_14_0_20_47_5]